MDIPIEKRETQEEPDIHEKVRLTPRRPFADHMRPTGYYYPGVTSSRDELDGL
jgi:hypothetical protein